MAHWRLLCERKDKYVSHRVRDCTVQLIKMMLEIIFAIVIPITFMHIFQWRTENTRQVMQYTVRYSKAQGCVMVNRTMCDTSKESSAIVQSDYAKIPSTRRNISSDDNRKPQRRSNPKSLDVQHTRRAVYRRLISIFIETNTVL